MNNIQNDATSLAADVSALRDRWKKGELTLSEYLVAMKQQVNALKRVSQASATAMGVR